LVSSRSERARLYRLPLHFGPVDNLGPFDRWACLQSPRIKVDPATTKGIDHLPTALVTINRFHSPSRR